MELPDDKGTYILIASVSQMRRLQVGSLGRFDLVIAARFENIDLLSEFITAKLGSIEGINSIQTSLHCKPIKIHNRLRLGNPEDNADSIDIQTANSVPDL